MKKNDMDMWKDSEFVKLFEQVELSATTIGAPALFKALFNKTAGHVTEYSHEGMVKQIADDAEDATKIESVNDKFQKYMADRGGLLIYRNIRAAGDSTIYLWKDGIVVLQIT